MADEIAAGREGETKRKKRPWWLRAILRLIGTGLLLGSAYLVLCIPAVDPPMSHPGEGAPFVWGQEDVWASLEALFRAAPGCDRAQASLEELEALLEELTPSTRASDPLLRDVESGFFEAAAIVASCPEDHLEALSELQAQLRARIKLASRHWAVDDRVGRDALYRLLYGTRMALEEAILHAPAEALPELQRGAEVPSSAPSATIAGVEVHSGDIALSRGGAPTSALIARGNDYPGNFSHVALIHVDARARASTIEAHIERGVVVADADTYFEDAKLRILLLRLRPEIADGALAAAAANFAREETLARHIPYDFRMDFRDPSKQFCSEVASHAYREQGVALWQGLSSISTEWTSQWLWDFGVREFRTQAPSDLEYDPNVQVVAEWRDHEALFEDHVSSAVVDALLEGAAAHGDRVSIDRWRLGVARLVKAFTSVEHLFGREGVIPEGMNATVALRVEWLRARHSALKEAVLEAARDYEAEQGFLPPYWTLVEMANAAREAQPR